MRASKGSDWERTICKQLSRWWSIGMGKAERDDVFWRSSQSGGRATQRAKSGLATFGSYGDIAAVDPIGAPLIKMFTIELKRGSSYSCPGDLLDFKADNGSHPWVKCLLQAIRSHEQAGSKAWLLLCKRDHRTPIAFLESDIAKQISIGPIANVAFMRMHLNIGGERIRFIGLPLDTLLEKITPAKIIQCLNL